MNKKIVSIIGSPRGRQSTSYHIVESLFEEIRNICEGVETEQILLSEFHLGLCKGCTSCFTNCSTCTQYNDGIKLIEDKLLDANIIFFVSPVYAHSLTGTMKNFIDRISYWLHIFKLTGKYGVVISVSNSNGNSFVDDYLSKMMEFMGVSVIEHIDYSNTHPLCKKDIISAAKKIRYYLLNDSVILNLDLKNKIFEVYKKAYQDEYDRSSQDTHGMMSKEILYWKENGYFECNTFQDLHELITDNGGI